MAAPSFLKSVVLTAALMAATISSALALQIQPVRVVLEPGQRTGTITVTNTFQRPVPIEVVALRRTVARDGRESFSPAERDFTIFPPQALLQPGQSQAIRFQFVGGQSFDTTQAYVVQVREVPVIPEGVSGVATVFHFGAAVYLQAAGAKPDLRLEGAKRSGDTLLVTVRNAGRDWGYLNRGAIRISVGGQTKELRGQELTEATENPLAPPLSVREYALRVPGLPSGEPKVELLLR